MATLTSTNGIEFFVDDEDVARVSAKRWSAKKPTKRSKSWYLTCTKAKDHDLGLHRFIMGIGPVDPRTVDHRDRNGLNNRKQNLRVSTLKQNLQNVPAREGHQHKNIYWADDRQMWRVMFSVDGKLQRYGQYEDLELALFVASEVRDKLHGEYACHD